MTEKKNDLQKLWARMMTKDFEEYLAETTGTVIQEVLFEDVQDVGTIDLRVGGVYLICYIDANGERFKVWKNCAESGRWTPELDGNWVEVYELEPGQKKASEYEIGDVVMRGDDDWVLFKTDAESWNVYKRIRVESNKSMDKIFETGRIENELF